MSVSLFLPFCLLFFTLMFLLVLVHSGISIYDVLMDSRGDDAGCLASARRHNTCISITYECRWRRCVEVQRIHLRLHHHRHYHNILGHPRRPPALSPIAIVVFIIMRCSFPFFLPLSLAVALFSWSLSLFWEFQRDVSSSAAWFYNLLKNWHENKTQSR